MIVSWQHWAAFWDRILVEAYIDENDGNGRIVLRPNASWPWRANVYLLGVLTVISLSIGVGFLTMGAWVILPFSIAELIIVSGCFYYCVRRCRMQQIISFSEDQVVIEHGISSPIEVTRFNRTWAKFLVLAPDHSWWHRRVVIRSHGSEKELGDFLNETDRERLVRYLRKTVDCRNRAFAHA